MSPIQRRFVALATFVFALFGAGPAASQFVVVKDNLGTSFWLAFPGNYSGGELSLFITGETATQGTVSVPGIGFSQAFSVSPGSITTVGVPRSAELTASDVVQPKGISVVADDEVAVYGLNRVPYTTDAYLGLPVDILATEYIVQAYKNVNVLNASQFAVVGTQEATTVTITPSVTTGSRSAGVPYDVTLNEGDAYLLRNTSAAPADLSGTVVTSDKPVAVFGSHQCANIPQGYYACDHIVEQLTPTTTWGRRFVTVPLATRRNGDTFRFLASTDGTTVQIDGVPVATLNRGQTHEQIVTAAAEVIADQPIFVAQYSNGSSFDGVTSDPFMMMLPPVEQFLSQYTVATPASGFGINYVNVVARDSAVGMITLDGDPIPSSSFSPVGSSGYSGAQIPVAVGAHRLEGPSGFGVFSYGFDSYDSYGYPGGMAIYDLRCREAGLALLAGTPAAGIASGAVHGAIEPVAGSIDPELEALIHTLNCDAIVPLEQLLDGTTNP